jgi:hypothetical protein
MILAGFEPRMSFLNRISPSELVEKAMDALSAIGLDNGWSGRVYSSWGYTVYQTRGMPPHTFQDDGRVAQHESVRNAMSYAARPNPVVGPAWYNLSWVPHFPQTFVSPIKWLARFR